MYLKKRISKINFLFNIGVVGLIYFLTLEYYSKGEAYIELYGDDIFKVKKSYNDGIETITLSPKKNIPRGIETRYMFT